MTRQNKDNNKKKSPPRKPIQSVQYDLFSTFVTNDVSQVSNSIDIWESIPKYFFTPKQTQKLRGEDGLAKRYKWQYSYNQMDYEVIIQPALIEQPDGSDQAFFPGTTEELVEEALKKILLEQRGIHDTQRSETWVRFTLGQLRKELKARGRSRNTNEIKHAIKVMSRCVISLHKEGKEVWTGSILQDLTTVGRDEYLDDTNAMHIARLPLFISYAIDQLEYRQFNYQHLMECNEQLSRWLYKQLIHRYRQASPLNTYHFLYTHIQRDSGMLQQGRMIDNRRKVVMALDELVSKEVLMSYDLDERKQGRQIVEVKYTVRPALAFVREQKAANKRASEAVSRLDIPSPPPAISTSK